MYLDLCAWVEGGREAGEGEIFKCCKLGGREGGRTLFDERKASS